MAIILALIFVAFLIGFSFYLGPISLVFWIVFIGCIVGHEVKARGAHRAS